MYQERDNGAGFAIGVISGAVIGAGVALLFAPKAGRMLRDDIATTTGRVREAISARYEALAARAGVELDNLHDTVEGAVDAVEARAKDALDSVNRRNVGGFNG